MPIHTPSGQPGISQREAGCVLSLAGRRLRLAGQPDAFVRSACARVCPPAAVLPITETAEWSVHVEPIPPDGALTAPATWSRVLGDHGWPRLALTATAYACASAVGQYGRGDELAEIVVDRDERLTRVRVPAGSVQAIRWVDWLLRAYFGGALLRGGWVFLHAAAVSFDGRAVLLGGAPGVGKSSLAHLLCRDLGAAFLADDLVFIAPTVGTSVQAVGWPTRVSLPIHLAAPFDGALIDSRQVSSNWRRERWLASPAEYCATYGLSRAASGRIAAVLLLDRTGDGVELAQLAADDSQVAFMTDRLGLVGPPAPERQAPESAAVIALLEHVPVLRLRTDHITARTAEEIWPRLRDALETESTS